MARLSTIKADGSPQLGVIWIELDGDDLGSGHMCRPMADPKQLGRFFPEPLRLDAGLTGRALSSAAGWHEAKTSRIESGKQAPGDSDIRIWCQACQVPDQAVDLIAASRAGLSPDAWVREGSPVSHHRVSGHAR